MEKTPTLGSAGSVVAQGKVGYRGAGTHSLEFSNCARTAMVGWWLVACGLV